METPDSPRRRRYLYVLLGLLVIVVPLLFFDERIIESARNIGGGNTNESKVRVIFVNNCTKENITDLVNGGVDKPTTVSTTGAPTQNYNYLPPLQDALDKFDWTDYWPYEGKRWPTKLMERYQRLLIPYLEQDPPAPIIIPRRPIPLSLTLNCNNPDYSNFLTGNRKEKIPKVYDFVMFSSELDVLETRFYELNDSVDNFVILEGTHTHRGVRKPLFFARNIERFAPFLDKVIHLVADFSDYYKYESDTQMDQDNWGIESTGRMYLWRNFLEAMEGEQNIGDDDLLVHGDLDEIPGGDILYHLKHCELKSGAIPAVFELTFYMHNFHWVIPKYLNLPSVFNKKHINGETFCRSCGRDNVLPHGGAHVTYFGGSVFQLYKGLSIAEGGFMYVHDAKNATYIDMLIKQGKRYCCLQDNWMYTKDTSAKTLGRMKLYVPWFPDANKERFPNFFPPKRLLPDD